MKSDLADGQRSIKSQKLSESEESVQCIFGDFSPFPEKIFVNDLLDISKTESSLVERIIVQHVMKQRSQDKQTRYQSTKIQGAKIYMENGDVITLVIDRVKGYISS